MPCVGPRIGVIGMPRKCAVGGRTYGGLMPKFHWRSIRARSGRHGQIEYFAPMGARAEFRRRQASSCSSQQDCRTRRPRAAAGRASSTSTAGVMAHPNENASWPLCICAVWGRRGFHRPESVARAKCRGGNALVLVHSTIGRASSAADTGKFFRCWGANNHTSLRSRGRFTMPEQAWLTKCAKSTSVLLRSCLF